MELKIVILQFLLYKPAGTVFWIIKEEIPSYQGDMPPFLELSIYYDFSVWLST